MQEASAAAAQASIAQLPAAAYANLAASGVLADNLAEQLAALGINNSSGAVEHVWVGGGLGSCGRAPGASKGHL